MGQIIDGKAAAARLRAQVAEDASELMRRAGVQPGLAVVIVGDDPASRVYVRNKGKQAVAAGFNSYTHALDGDVAEDELLDLVDRLNADPEVHGILVQLPLPDHIDEAKVIHRIDPTKDVDGFHVTNVGLLAIGRPAFVPCTPLGCRLLLQECLGDLSGLDAVIVGRSNIVGKPMAALLLLESCTVSVAHSRTRDLPELCRRADILVAAVGRPGLVQGDWVKPGAAVIDVGINRVVDEEGNARLVGDVDFEAARARAGHITPVPGGVGPMTIACLLKNTLTAAQRAA